MSGVATFVAFVSLWQVAVAGGLVSFDYVPPALDVVREGARQAAHGDLVAATLHTLGAALAAWAIALVVGVAAGTALGTWPRARTLFQTSVDVLRTLPVIAFVPVAALLFGLSTTTEIAVAAWSALWPILVNTVGAVRAIHPRLREVGAVLQLSTARRLRCVLMPAAAPLILVGARLGLSLSLIVTVAAEMLANPQGLGYRIVEMQQALRPEAMFAYIVVVGLVGMALNSGLIGIAGRVVPGVVGQGERAR